MTIDEDWPTLRDEEAERNDRGGRTWTLTRDSHLPADFNWDKDVVRPRGYRLRGENLRLGGKNENVK